jgi:hypothetical protein
MRVRVYVPGEGGGVTFLTRIRILNEIRCKYPKSKVHLLLLCHLLHADANIQNPKRISCYYALHLKEIACGTVTGLNVTETMLYGVWRKAKV